MKTLGRYLFSRFVGTFLIFFLLFTSLFVLVELFEIKESRTLDAHIIERLATYILLRMPFLAYASSPIAAFLSSIYVVAARAHRSEVIAAQAGGISIFRYSSPIVGASVVLAIFLLLGSEYKIPEWSDRADYIRRVEIQKKSPPKAEFLDIAFSTEDHYVLAERFVPDDGIIETATLILPDTDPSQPMKVEHFSLLTYLGDSWDKARLPAPKVIELMAASSAVKVVSERPLETTRFSTLLREIHEFKRLLKTQRHYRLEEEIKERYVKIHAKLAFPLSVPFLVLLGAGLGARIGRRRGLGAAVSAALVASLGYMFMVQTSVNVGELAASSPSFGTYAPIFPWLVPITIAIISIRLLNPLK